MKILFIEMEIVSNVFITFYFYSRLLNISSIIVLLLGFSLLLDSLMDLCNGSWTAC